MAPRGPSSHHVDCGVDGEFYDDCRFHSGVLDGGGVCEPRRGQYGGPGVALVGGAQEGAEGGPGVAWERPGAPGHPEASGLVVATEDQRDRRVERAEYAADDGFRTVRVLTFRQARRAGR